MNVAALYFCAPAVIPWLMWWALTQQGMALWD